jgi:hypothetical protein
MKISISAISLTFALLKFIPSFSQNEVLKDSGVVSNLQGTTTISGYVDAYYAFNLNQPPDKNIQYLYNYNRHNEFNVNLAILSAKYNSEKIRGTISLQTGTYAEANYSSEPVLARHIYEAYAGFKTSKATWLDAGVFSSHIGFESAIANNNWTLSRSLSAENTPYYETGLRFSYDPSERWGYCFFLLNGWQNIREVNTGKAIGTQIQYKPDSKILINWSTYFGTGTTDTFNRARIFNDFYATLKLSKRWRLAALFDIGFQKNTNNSDFESWYNAGLLARYELTNHTSLTGRAEYYYDPGKIIINTTTPNGFQTIGTSINFDYMPIKNYMVRLEAKYYKAIDKVFNENKNINGYQSVIFTGDMIISF